MRAFIILCLIVTLVFAEPIRVDVEERQLDSIIGDVTGAFGTVTGVVGSVIGEITAAPGQIATFVTSVGGQAATVVTQVGGAAYTLGPGQVTSFGGQVWTVLTSEGQAGFTAVTGAAGSAISNALTHTSNSASTLPNWALSTPLTMSLIAVLSGIFFGARMAF